MINMIDINEYKEMDEFLCLNVFKCISILNNKRFLLQVNKFKGKP